MSKSPNTVWHTTSVTKAERQRLNGHKSCVLWFTGLSGSGKSTIANAVEDKLHQLGVHTYLLDGDNVRHGLSKDLGFKKEDRIENIRRIGEVAKLFVDGGMIVLSAFISPYIVDRKEVRSILQEDEFIEIYVKCPLSVCEQRDPKGLYKKARKGEIKNFTGITDPYEEPNNPEVVINSNKHTIEDAVKKIINYLTKHNIISIN
jgi:adenylylsulfate kinase